MENLTSPVEAERARHRRNDQDGLPRRVSRKAQGHILVQDPTTLDTFLRQPGRARGKKDGGDVADWTPPVRTAGCGRGMSREPRIVEPDVAPAAGDKTLHVIDQIPYAIGLQMFDQSTMGRRHT